MMISLTIHQFYIKPFSMGILSTTFYFSYDFAFPDITAYLIALHTSFRKFLCVLFRSNLSHMTSLRTRSWILLCLMYCSNLCHIALIIICKADITATAAIFDCLTWHQAHHTLYAFTDKILNPKEVALNCSLRVFFK